MSPTTATLSAQQQLATLFRVSHLLSRIGDLHTLLRLVMEEAERTVSAQASSIALVEEPSGRLVFYVATGAQGRALRAITLAKGQGIIGYVALHGRPINCPDVRRDPRFEAGVDKKTHFQTRSVLAIPLRRRRRLIGVLEVLNKRGGSRRFTARDQALLGVVADQAAIAIENAKLVQRLTQEHRALARALRQLRLSQRRLVETERLSTVGLMASAVIHDLKNPLASVKSFCQMLTMEQLEQEEVRAFTGEAVQAIDEFVAGARDVLEYASGQVRLDRQPTRLRECIEAAVGILRPLLESQRITVQQTIAVERPVSVDPVRLRRVLTNVLGNAKDAMPDGGTITISACEVDGAVEVAIADTGVGIPPEVRRRLFQPFVTYGKPHGTGLGMAIVKSIVEAHGGQVTVESRTASERSRGASGTTVRIRVPV